METLEKVWRQRSGTIFHAKPIVSDAGILFGVGTVLVRGTGGHFDFASDAERAIGLLSIAKRGSAGPHLLHHFRAAALAWRRGERALAQFHLAYARIAPLESREDAKRLFLAEALIEAGVPPLELARMVGAGPQEFGKRDCYDPNQPRNPAGCGDESGRWTKEPGAGDGTEHTITVHPHLAFAPPIAPPPSLINKILSKEAREFLIATAKRGFGELIEGGVAGVIAYETFRTIFIPSPNDGVITQGELPGQPGVRYEANHDSGTLTIDASGTGAYQPIFALLGQGGIYREVESGVMIAQNLGDGIVMLDPDLLATLDQPKRSGESENPPWGGGGGGVQSRTGPKLCLEPVPERGGSADPMASEYQQFVRDHVNGQRFPQMPPELTIALPAATPSGRVWYDDCDELNGDMIEAKSGTSGFLYSERGNKKIAENFLEQAMKQINAMGSSRKGRWYLRDKGYYDFTKQLFQDNGLSDKIDVHYLPYLNPKKFQISSLGRRHDRVYS